MSPADVVRAYLVERYATTRFAVLALLLTLAACMVSSEITNPVVAVPRTIITTWLLVLALRVWDDLADRRADAVRHPNRITVRVQSTSPFAALGASAMLAGGGLITVGPDFQARLPIGVALIVALAVWYGIKPVCGSPRLCAYVVLLKYPVLVTLVAPGPIRTALHATPVLLAVLVLLCVHETFDDPAMRPLTLGRGSQS